jgi:TM2 domain-containing membrane protein YozV
VLSCNMELTMPEDTTPDTKPCPLCGEEIKKVAVRCKHCQADLTKAAEPDFNRGAPVVGAAGAGAAAARPMDDFEVRFLEFAYQTTATINVPAVAHALRLPTSVVSEKLEDMAARDVILRDTDDEGNLFFAIPGRVTSRPAAHPPLATVGQHGQLAHVSAPADGTAIAAMVLNVFIPGSGSLVAGRVSIGVVQLILWIIGIPLSFVLIGLPMVLTAWIWSLVTGIQILEESRRRQSSS